MTLTQIKPAGLSTPVDLADNARIRLGTGNDLQIHHDGTNSFITNATNDLYINSIGDDLILKAADDAVIQVQGSENAVLCNGNGSVELYFDSSKKFETTSIGCKLTDNDTTVALQFVNSDGNNGYVMGESTNIIGFKDNQAHWLTKCFKDGGVELYYDNSLMLDVKSWGVEINGHLGLDDNRKVALGNGPDLEIYHDGTNNIINTITGSLLHQYNGTTVALQTDTRLGFQDNKKASFGTGNDLEIFHDGSNSYITDNGPLIIRGDGLQLQRPNGNMYLKCIAGNTVELYFDNSKKFETTSIGATVTGALHATTTNITTQMFMPDQGQIRLGNSDDLKLYHDGHSIIRNDEIGAAMFISSHETIMANTSFNEAQAKFIQNGAVELYYDNSLKFTTTTNGVSLFGDLRFNNGTWTGESLTGKIQTHSGHMYLQNASTSGSWIYRLPNGSEPANINSSGTYSGSDARRKKDITTITSAVDTIKQLVGRSFTWKEDDKKSFGLIAQEVEPVLPELVTTQTVVPGETNSDPYKMVNYAALTGHLVEAIKELSTKVAALEAA